MDPAEKTGLTDKITAILKDGSSPNIIVALIIGGVFVSVLLSAAYQSMEPMLKTASTQEVIVYITSWLLLLALSYGAVIQIKEILSSDSGNKLKRRACQIAIMIGLVLIIFLFKQPYLHLFFSADENGLVLNIILVSISAATGWFAWSLKNIRKYGEFFHVLLLTVIVGMSWYARLIAPEAVQLATLALIIASLLRIAKDYMDAAAEGKSA